MTDFTLSKNLKFSSHIRAQANKAVSILEQLRRTFRFWTDTTFKTLYCGYVRPHLEYAAVVWSPHTNKDCNIPTKRSDPICSTTHYCSPDQLKASEDIRGECSVSGLLAAYSGKTSSRTEPSMNGTNYQQRQSALKQSTNSRTSMTSRKRVCIF